MKGFESMREKIRRTDSPNRTTQELLDDGWVFLHNKYENIIKAMMMLVRSELDRVYWNANQKEMVNPLENTGADDFVTDYLTIRSYNWEENELPNFDTDELKVFWYKHANRGVNAMVKRTSAIGAMLANVLNNSIESIDDAFKTKKGEK